MKLAVYTSIPDDELTEFLTLYDIGDLHSLKGIAEGVENSNFLLVTDAGPHILTLYEKRVAEEDLPFFLGLMQHLAEQGINCPQPVPMRSGKFLTRLAGRPAAIISYLDGNSVTRAQPDHCHQLGDSLARMHLAGEGFLLKRSNALALKDWRPLFQYSEERADEVLGGLQNLINNELNFLEENWPGDLSAGIIHADLFPDNVFFLQGKLSGIIDYYFACNDLFAYDMAICINAWCFEPGHAFNVTKARALLEGYSSVRPLIDDEYKALPILCRGASLRFLLTRLYDWLNVPPGALVTPKNPTEYISKLKFHQSVKSASEYGLDGVTA